MRERSQRLKNMEIVAQVKSVRISPRKVRLVADAVRKLSVSEALLTLGIVKKRGSSAIEKTLRSALANAINNKNLSEEALFIKAIDVTEGPAFKRFHASTRGRAHPYKKKSSHIRVVLAEKASKPIVKAVSEKTDKKDEKIKNQKSNLKNENKKGEEIK